MSENVPARRDPFAILALAEADMTAPIAASIELSKQYMLVMNHLEQLQKEVWVEDIKDADGVVIRTVTHFPRDYKWFLELGRKLANDVGKLTANIETKAIENKIKVMDIFLNTDAVDKETKQKFAQLAIMEKLAQTQEE